MLTSAELDTYHRDGLVCPAGFRVPEPLLARLRQATTELVEYNAPHPSDRLINVHLDGAPPFGLRGDPAFGEVARLPAILDMVCQVLGQDVILWSTHLFCKPASTGREVPLHQDGHYWPIRPLATCSVWLAIDAVDEQNGALRYLPGSHQNGAYLHYEDNSPALALNQAVEPEQYDDADLRHTILPSGAVSLHDVHLVHGSAANTSGRRRAGLAMRYMPADTHFRRDLVRKESSIPWANMPLVLVRGRNRHPGNDLEVGHPEV